MEELIEKRAEYFFLRPFFEFVQIFFVLLKILLFFVVFFAWYVAENLFLLGKLLDFFVWQFAELSFGKLLCQVFVWQVAESDLINSSIL